MLIEEVRLGTADLSAAVGFYRDVLELPVALRRELQGDTATVSIGRSAVTLTQRGVTGESNHIAFTIPSNRFAAARRWLTARVELMSWKAGETELRLGEPWNSESLYFMGPDGIILELITRGHLENPADDPFSSAQLLCVSEVGLGTPGVAADFAQARAVFGIDTFAGESEHFTTAGDQDGLLILVTSGRPWFPTDDMRADTGTVAVTISGVTPGFMRSDAGWTVTAV